MNATTICAEISILMQFAGCRFDTSTTASQSYLELYIRPSSSC